MTSSVVMVLDIPAETLPGVGFSNSTDGSLTTSSESDSIVSTSESGSVMSSSSDTSAVSSSG